MKKLNSPHFLYYFFVSIVVFALYCLWFVFLDQRLVFLYGHMHATPFDAFTASRHWMTGLVVSGIIFLIYTVINLIVKKLNNNYQLPNWKSVWKYSCLILVLPLFGMLTFTGKPPMSVILSLWILVVLFSGLALASYISSFIVSNFRRSVWAFFNGLAIVPILTLFAPSIAFGLRRVSMQTVFLLAVPAIVLSASLFWFWIMTMLHKRFKQPYSSSTKIFLSGLTVSYLLMPLLHYITSYPGHIRYITNSDNFFANSFWLQIATFLLITGIIWLVSRLRGKKKTSDFGPVKSLLFLLILFSLGSFLVTKIVTGKETDIWLCEDDKWIKQGNPPYEKPFDEECGIIDKEMGL